MRKNVKTIFVNKRTNTNMEIIQGENAFFTLYLYGVFEGL